MATRKTSCNGALVRDDGATTVEYAVMLALIVGICVVAVRSFGTATSTSFDGSKTAITNATGGS